MPEFWEKNFSTKGEIWGFEPARSAVLTKDFFIKKSVKNILIPGIGYGRNAAVFKDNGIQVSGIEISRTAINLAQKHYGSDMVIHHGSVMNMPFDSKKYEGIFCHALIHLLNPSERARLIQGSYEQLTTGGYMFFTAITKEAPNYGRGTFISKDRYEFHAGAQLFFYDREAVQAEFGAFGLFEVEKVEENQPMFLIKCQRE